MQSVQDTTQSFPFSIPIPESVLEPGEFFILIQKLVVAVLIGILIGLEREFSRPKSGKIFAGIRTYPLVSMLGFSSALIASFTETWMYGIFFLGYATLITTAYFISAKEGRIGGTSDIAALLVFLLGSLVYWSYLLIAATIAVVTMLFLSSKLQLRKFVGNIRSEDILSIMKLGIITIIILPLIPNEVIDPLKVLNPSTIWLMVIFISGLSFLGYLLVKYIGKDKGISLTGFLGGLVSSTAVTISMSKKSKESESLAGNYAVGVILASSIMYIRVYIIILFLDTQLAIHIWPPLLLLGAVGLIVSFILTKKVKEKQVTEFELKNPLELKFALLFGLIFAIVIIATKAAQIYLGTEGMYAVSAMAGITSVDAIVLSVIQLLPASVSISTAVAAIIIATASNDIVKLGIALYWGSKEYKKNVTVGLGLLVTVSLIMLVFYI